MSVARRPRIVALERQVKHVAHERDPRRIARDDVNQVMLELIVAGRMTYRFDGAERQAGPGEIVIFDTRRPHRNWTSGAHSVAVALARDALAPDLYNGPLARGLVLGPDQAEALIRQVYALRPHAGDVGPGFLPDAWTPGQEAGLLGETLGATLGALDDPSRSNSALLSGPRAYARVLAFLDRHIADRRMTIADVAQGSGLSRSGLYRLFEGHGGVAQFIQRQRLLRMYRDLRSGAAGRSIGDLAEAAGFASSAHATRCFRETFGITPGAARHRRPSSGETTTSPRDVIDPWFDELL